MAVRRRRARHRTHIADGQQIAVLRLGHKVAKFRQINNGQPNVHHDALEFPDGRTVLLTQLCKGQRATVLQLPARIGGTADEQSTVSAFASLVEATLVVGAD
jgi:hypothetical protein